MTMTALLWLPAIALSLLLLRAMRPKGPASALLLWVWVALLPLFLGGTSAMYGQAKARQALVKLGKKEWPVEVQNGPQRVKLRLSTEQAICFARIIQRQEVAKWKTVDGLLLLNEKTRISGTLPKSETVRNVAVLGQRHCKRWLN